MIVLSKNGMLKACRSKLTTAVAIPMLVRDQTAAEEEEEAEPPLPNLPKNCRAPGGSVTATAAAVW